ncbi:secretin N-terminal domain-containing protein [Mesorhizobium sp.]|uniref:secretin N-terminal domain-containing protein n=1 Tax=Mesorhizobium sp. TaxID=1871066 RepID=UPI0004946E83|nr:MULTISPECIES: secretin N-terminal domain-containing protein [Mesorhizobium]TIQ30221.1 MAG: nodulation protein NolW [Mesorhizobium sp.]
MPRTLIQPVTLHVLRLLCAGFFLSTGIHPAHAVPLSLPATPYRYTVLDQELAAALQEFGNNLNIRVNISPAVKGRIRGRMPDLPPRAFLDRLTNLYGLQWYYDGLVLYVSAAQESQTRMLLMTSISFDAFKGALDKLDISDERYVVKPVPGNGLVFVSGPPRFVALVEQTFNGLVAEAQAQTHIAATPKESVLILFRGSSTTVVRDGRPDASYSSDIPQQDSVGGKPELGKK